MSTNINIPIYRAKKKDSDEWVEGCLLNKLLRGVDFSANDTMVVISDWINSEYEIDPTTLSIHFQNTFREKIFFGINTYLGGDEVEAEFLDGTPFKGIALFNGYECRFYDKNDDWVKISSLKNIKAIRIHKGCIK